MEHSSGTTHLVSFESFKVHSLISVDLDEYKKFKSIEFESEMELPGKPSMKRRLKFGRNGSRI